jgi:hypothetical protein
LHHLSGGELASEGKCYSDKGYFLFLGIKIIAEKIPTKAMMEGGEGRRSEENLSVECVED